MKYFILVVCLSLTSIALSQEPLYKMQKYEDTLIILKKIQLSVYPDKYIDNLSDSVYKIMSRGSFDSLLLVVLKMEESWDYSFDRLQIIFKGLSIYKSKDKKLRIISVVMSNYEGGVYGTTYAQYLTKNNELIFQELKMNNFYYGNKVIYQSSSLTFGLFDISTQGTNTYLLLRYYKDRDMGRFNSAQIWMIDSDTLAKKICYNSSNSGYNYVQEVSGDLVVRTRHNYRISLEYEPSTKMLTHNKYKKLEMEGGDIYFLPTKEKAKYKLINGKFIKIENLEQSEGK